VRATAVLAGLGSILVAVPAWAHIKLTAPADWLMTSSAGDPQKVAPCGVDPSTSPGPSAYTPTNAVTTVHAGQTLTVSWVEEIPHDGHFRIALALHARDELKDPAVTATNPDGTPSAVSISTDYPVLADNLFPHKASDVAAGKTYSVQVTIPGDASCTKCTLQVIQFMAEHPADPSYFYHHCADLSIVGAAPDGGASGTDAGRPAADAGPAGTGGAPSSGTGETAGAGTGGAGAIGTGGARAGGTGGSSSTGAGGASSSGSGGAAAAGTGGARSAGTGGATTPPGGSSSSGGCSCETAPAGGAGLAALAVVLLAGLARRRRRA
jgi:MYXO-CTERM domain-containing protein